MPKSFPTALKRDQSDSHYIHSVAQKVISVFGSSRCAETDNDYRIAMELGGALARAGFAVASGGYGGTMEAVSRGAAEAGGRVIGVVASAFSNKANRWVGETIVVPKWEDRLWKLISFGEGYVALPGGTGTLVELAVAWEMIHKRVMPAKPLVATRRILAADCLSDRIRRRQQPRPRSRGRNSRRRCGSA